MPTYITLLKFTQQGIQTIKEGPKRLDTAKKRFKDAGAELKAFYLVLGEYGNVEGRRRRSQLGIEPSKNRSTARRDGGPEPLTVSRS